MFLKLFLENAQLTRYLIMHIHSSLSYAERKLFPSFGEQNFQIYLHNKWDKFLYHL